ncbi:MAG: signal peptidase I [Oscillospiraceae bacterium]|jgi:signal peptidase I|nr:signal peptidase I [Oscillospiraceae bacterium]
MSGFGKERRGAPRTHGLALLVFCGLLSGMLVLLFLFSALLSVSADPAKALFGHRAYVVLTRSMVPTVQPDGTTPKGGFYPGDLIIVRLSRPEDVKAGDVITFNPSFGKDSAISVVMTHRVAEIRNGEDGRFFVTKGDHNFDLDPPIPAEALIGIKVAAIPKLGGIFQTAQTHMVLTVCFVVLLLIGVAGAAVVGIVYCVRPGRRRGRPQ